MRMIPIILLVATVPLVLCGLMLWLSGVLGFSILITLMIIGFFAIWAMALVDVFRREDLGGGAKAVWALAMLVLPIIGLLAYVIARPPAGDLTYGGEAHA